MRGRLRRWTDAEHAESRSFRSPSTRAARWRSPQRTPSPRAGTRRTFPSSTCRRCPAPARALSCPCARSRRSGTAQGQTLFTIDSESDGFTAFALHPNDRELATSGRSMLIKIWDLTTGTRPGRALAQSGANVLACSGKCLRSWRGHTLPVLDMAFDGTGTLLATGSTGTIPRLQRPSRLPLSECLPALPACLRTRVSVQIAPFACGTPRRDLPRTASATTRRW
jgi:WD40 repeat protein